MGIKKLYSNCEIGGMIYLQMCHLKIDFILKDQREDFLDSILAIMHKLHVTKYHMNNYIAIQKEQLQQCQASFGKGDYTTREALELIYELEAFLFQVKSSLDMMVKLLIPIVGKDIVHTKTFGDKGKKVIKGLEKFREKSGVNISAISNLIELIKSDKDSWLEWVVDIRDELNHIRGLRDYGFEQRKLPDGKLAILKPCFKNMNTVDFMNLVYSKNLGFHQDFIAYSLAIKAPPTFMLKKANPEITKEEFGDDGHYVKWGWGVILNRK